MINLPEQEAALKAAGLTLFTRLNGDRYEWFPADSDVNFVFPRFTSREQATTYAHYQIRKQAEADAAIEYMIALEQAKGLNDEVYISHSMQ